MSNTDFSYDEANKIYKIWLSAVGEPECENVVNFIRQTAQMNHVAILRGGHHGSRATIQAVYAFTHAVALSVQLFGDPSGSSKDLSI